jgi:hypothetical protein
MNGRFARTRPGSLSSLAAAWRAIPPKPVCAVSLSSPIPPRDRGGDNGDRDCPLACLAEDGDLGVLTAPYEYPPPVLILPTVDPPNPDPAPMDNRGVAAREE